eukprot:TRINITY_DN5659_c0_g1_i1.p2 TRINITY_DN5659_c0_g1~~TRINITY_DN5659_c0_g1_i1.p2  ORF type:complete len:204 (-),score=-17.89 TRINITY_DN5659_c0_g1_i1:850-1461(-)
MLKAQNNNRKIIQFDSIQNLSYLTKKLTTLSMQYQLISQRNTVYRPNKHIVQTKANKFQQQHNYVSIRLDYDTILQKTYITCLKVSQKQRIYKINQNIKNVIKYRFHQIGFIQIRTLYLRITCSVLIKFFTFRLRKYIVQFQCLHFVQKPITYQFYNTTKCKILMSNFLLQVMPLQTVAHIDIQLDYQIYYFIKSIKQYVVLT